MRILQSIAGFGTKSGGTSTCTYDLLKAMHKLGYPVNLLTVDVDNGSDRLMGERENWIKVLPNDSRTAYGYSRNINRFLQDSEYDLYHTHGLWMHCNHATCAVARKKHKPYVITPHGMLYPQAMRRSVRKKKLMMALCFNQDLRQADCLHVTCRQEMEHIRTLGYDNSVAVIPNPVPMHDFLQDIQRDNNIRRIGFLGRLHPRKNVEALLHAWNLLGEKARNTSLIIMGNGEAEYEKFLRHEVQKSGLSNVEFTGFISGIEKFEKLASLTALCVPSDFENFGMIVTEALSVGTPVIASLGTPWEELDTAHCGWWVGNDPETLAESIDKTLSLPDDELIAMGENGKRLVEKYRDTHVAGMMKSLYEWILGGKKKVEQPEFVYEK